jgi:hypothetical protein
MSPPEEISKEKMNKLLSQTLQVIYLWLNEPDKYSLELMRWSAWSKNADQKTLCQLAQEDKQTSCNTSPITSSP